MSTSSDQYERLVAELHQALICADGVTTVTVDHNTTIRGKSGATHQIDVYWEFRLGGSFYKTCIECKHYNSKVKKMHVAAFASVLDDIGGTTGIFATTSGYQRGAVLLARQRNIRIVLVNPLLKEVNVNYRFLVPHTTISAMEFDIDAVRERLRELGLSEYNDHLMYGANEPILDKNGNHLMTLAELIRRSGDGEGDRTIALVDHHLNTKIGCLPLKSLSYTVTHSHIEVEDKIVIDGAARAILEDVLENTACYLNDDGTISRVET